MLILVAFVLPGAVIALGLALAWHWGRQEPRQTVVATQKARRAAEARQERYYATSWPLR